MLLQRRRVWKQVNLNSLESRNGCFMADSPCCMYLIDRFSQLVIDVKMWGRVALNKYLRLINDLTFNYSSRRCHGAEVLRVALYLTVTHSACSTSFPVESTSLQIGIAYLFCSSVFIFILTSSLMFPWCHRFARSSLLGSYSLWLWRFPWNYSIITY